MNKLSTSILQNFILGGIGTTILGYLIEYVPSGIAYSCYLYGALPTVHIFLLWITYKAHGVKEFGTLHVHLSICCGIFIFYMLSIHFLHKLGIMNYPSAFLWSTLAFIIVSIMYFKLLIKKKF